MTKGVVVDVIYKKKLVHCTLNSTITGNESINNVRHSQFKGGQNFFEKIRTFSEQIRTIRRFFGGIQSVRFVHFFLEKIHTNRTFKKNKPIFEKNHKNEFFLQYPLCSRVRVKLL